MKITVAQLDPFPLDDLGKFQHHFEEGQRVRVKETGHRGKLKSISNGGHYNVMLDSGHFIECHRNEIEPEDFPQLRTAVSREKSSAFSRVDGLVRALEAGTVSILDRVQITSLLGKIRTGTYATDPLACDDRPDYDNPYHMLKVYADKYASGAAPGAFDVLAKRAQQVDPSKLHIGMKVRGFAGKIGRITKIKNGAVDIEYEDGGSGTTLFDHVEAA